MVARPTRGDTKRAMDEAPVVEDRFDPGRPICGKSQPGEAGQRAAEVAGEVSVHDFAYLVAMPATWGEKGMGLNETRKRSSSTSSKPAARMMAPVFRRSSQPSKVQAQGFRSHP